MDSLEAELSRARDLDVGALADSIEAIGFECTRCGGCCTGDPLDGGDGAGDGEEADDGDESGGREPHTATVFPDEVRGLQSAAEATFGEAYDWRDVARPMPFGLSGEAEGDGDSGGGDGGRSGSGGGDGDGNGGADGDADGDGDGNDAGVTGETFEWALATDACGDCTFYEETDGQGACTVHDARPLICRTYPFSVALGGTSQPMGEAVDAEGLVRAHEGEGLGRDIPRADAEELAAALKRRAIRELEEAIAVRDTYEPADVDGVVVHDSEGQKRPDGTPVEGSD